jgi:predicted double-glycine peptidase
MNNILKKNNTKTKVLNVKPFRQSRGFCGPACLKMILEFYGLEKSEQELGKLSKCTKSKGTSAENIIKAAKKLGFEAHVENNSNLARIKYFLNRETPVIVDWFSHDEGHYSVAVSIDDENIYLQDPELGAIRTLNRQTFFRVGFDFPKAYIRTPKDIILRRIIVIEKKKIEKNRKIIPRK